MSRPDFDPAADDDTPIYESVGVLEDPRPEFLPLPIRRVLYVLSLAGAVAAPVLAVSAPEYAAAIVTGASVLSAAALGTALANPSR